MIITNIQDYISGRSIFEIFEDEFGRPITHKELMTISDMVDKYTEEKVLLALREAMIYHKLSLNYIVRVLENGALKDD